MRKSFPHDTRLGCSLSPCSIQGSSPENHRETHGVPFVILDCKGAPFHTWATRHAPLFYVPRGCISSFVAGQHRVKCATSTVMLHGDRFSSWILLKELWKNLPQTGNLHRGPQSPTTKTEHVMKYMFQCSCSSHCVNHNPFKWVTSCHISMAIPEPWGGLQKPQATQERAERMRFLSLLGKGRATVERISYLLQQGHMPAHS